MIYYSLNNIFNKTKSKLVCSMALQINKAVEFLLIIVKVPYTWKTIKNINFRLTFIERCLRSIKSHFR
jgi:hypothetical protein